MTAKKQTLNTVLRTTVSARDAWDQPQIASVSWMPRLADLHDVRYRPWEIPVLWGTTDEPPVMWSGIVNGTCHLVKNCVDMSGTSSHVYEPVRVESVDDLEPGCYVVTRH